MKCRIYGFIGLLFLSLTIFACGKKGGGVSGANTEGLDSNRKEQLFVWVENARIRKGPDLNAEVVTEIPGGEKVTLTGAVSDTKIKVKLRGVEFEDFWVKVITLNGTEGWIFKGMLTENETKAIAMNDFLINPGIGVGAVKVGSKRKEVEEIFGKSFLVDAVIYDDEGIEWPGFYVFKDTPLELQCVINETSGGIDNIKIRQPNNYWHTEEGIKIGTTIDAMVQLNGKPISFDCFGNMQGAWISSFGKGKLNKYAGTIGICLGEPNDLTGLDEFMQEGECSSNNKAILGKGVKVAEMVIYAPAIM